ncbi:EAL domain-containing protein [Burkholderia multivorans]|uniref:sensor domain-containing phosphodiesterase n=1 Tax=Burkholderia multivorans TaxID=87883 RepID=UPI001C22EFB1|nr:EAL domain-containing protein [Burkholderia multivorans]MBU9601118.1 EAL domain-containing protein [Burkholderia multivorans]
MTTEQQERPVVASPYRFEREVSSGFERFATRHRELTLTTVFQPIFSLAHQRAVGYEALLRAHDTLDRAVSPLDVFGDAARHGELLQLDRLAQALHLENFALLGASREWLFLNVHPGVLTDPFQAAALLANLKRLGIPPRRIVLEVLEQRADDVERLADAVRACRAQGFLIALDDFGAGYANVERIWQLDPDIVKLDRILLSQAAHRTGPTAILHGLVALLHEAGKLVLVEGIETEHDAQVALACEADFVQGYYFGRPAPGLPDSAAATGCIGELTERFREQADARERRDAQRLAPYLRAFERAAERLAAGEPLDDVCWNFLALDDAARCFLLDARGRQAGRNIVLRADRAPRETRFSPLSEAQGANWLRRPYFRTAIAEPGRVQVTRPYLSINEAQPCVTLSIAIRIGDAQCVLCGDIDWTEG